MTIEQKSTSWENLDDMSIKVLIVEDEEDITQLLKLHLEKEGYFVKVANDGEKALSIIKSEALDLVLLDLMIPGMDGITLNRQLKMDPKLEAIPVIMLTAKSDETDVIVGLEMGAEDYITKPFSHKVVLARIKHVLKRKAVSVKKQSITHYKTLSVNTNAHEVSVENKIIVVKT